MGKKQPLKQPSKPIGLLRAGWLQPALSRDYGEYPPMFSALLAEADWQPDLVTYDVVDGQFPNHIDDCESYLISGSKFGVYDDASWIPTLADFLGELIADKKRVAGVCFGHQIIAQVLGGRVEKSDKGWGIGVLPTTVNEPVNTALSLQLPPQINLVHSHQDQVVELPPGASLIAGSEFCPNAIFAFEDRMLGVQGHPEFSAKFAASVYASREHLFPATLYQQANQSLTQPINSLELAGLIRKFLQPSVLL